MAFLEFKFQYGIQKYGTDGEVFQCIWKVVELQKMNEVETEHSKSRGVAVQSLMWFTGGFLGALCSDKLVVQTEQSIVK